jgi:hypothetical protein
LECRGLDAHLDLPLLVLPELVLDPPGAKVAVVVVHAEHLHRLVESSHVVFLVLLSRLEVGLSLRVGLLVLLVGPEAIVGLLWLLLLHIWHEASTVFDLFNDAVFQLLDVQLVLKRLRVHLLRILWWLGLKLLCKYVWWLLRLLPRISINIEASTLPLRLLLLLSILLVPHKELLLVVMLLLALSVEVILRWAILLSLGLKSAILVHIKALVIVLGHEILVKVVVEPVLHGVIIHLWSLRGISKLVVLLREKWLSLLGRLGPLLRLLSLGNEWAGVSPLVLIHLQGSRWLRLHWGLKLLLRLTAYRIEGATIGIQHS